MVRNFAFFFSDTCVLQYQTPVNAHSIENFHYRDFMTALHRCVDESTFLYPFRHVKDTSFGFALKKYSK